MSIDQPGIEFEKIVTDIQKQLDPCAEVTHNQVLVDRLGQKRQFDVVIRGRFAGQEILGVIECKDLSKKVGTPDIDAFVTKASEINANFKIVVSKSGFSKPAITKAKHYGVQTLSLLPEEKADLGFIVGTKWHADIFRWNQVSIQLHFSTPPIKPVIFDARDLKIYNKSVLDWFTNYLLKEHPDEKKEGWIVGVIAEFEKPHKVQINSSQSYECTGIEFHAERVKDKREKFVGMSGTGFYDWQKEQVSMPKETTISSHGIPIDFHNWPTRASDEFENNGFLQGKLSASMVQFEFTEDVIDIGSI